MVVIVGNGHNNNHGNGHGNGNNKSYNTGYHNSYRNDYKRFWWFARNLNVVLGFDSTSELASLEPLRTETHVKTRGRAGASLEIKRSRRRDDCSFGLCLFCLFCLLCLLGLLYLLCKTRAPIDNDELCDDARWNVIGIEGTRVYSFNL